MRRAGKPPRPADDWYLCINKRAPGAVPWRRSVP